MTVTLRSHLVPTRSPDALRAGLLPTLSLLRTCRAAEIGEGFIDDYVALNWLEWNGGSLRLTVTGDNVRKQLLSAQ